MSEPTAQSPLATSIGAFLAHHRALGKRFDTEEAALRLLDRYLVEQRIETLAAITPAVLEAFVRSRPRTRPRSYNHLVNNVLSRLFLWLERQEMLVPSPLHLQPRHATSALTPFLFEPAQVERLLALAAQLPNWPHGHRRGATYRLIFALMYALGLRVGEVARLCRQDVDWQRQCLVIRQSKFGKSRLVPFGPNVGQALAEHLQGASDLSLSPQDPLFSLSRDQRQPIYPKTISRTFHRLVGQLDLAVPPGVAPPRSHCLRHTFAVATLQRWYRSGVNPAARLHVLSTFLGHVNPNSTTVYLTITTELLEQANAQFERYAAAALRGEER